MEISKFSISKLHGSYDFELVFKNNTLILLGENGSCKTTIIKMLFYTLSLQWGKLSNYDFEKIELAFENKTKVYQLSKKDLLFADIDVQKLRHMPPSLRHEISEMTHRNDFDLERIQHLCMLYGVPFNYILGAANEDMPELFQDTNNEYQRKLAKTREEIKELLTDIHILYLPTYRRIEQELKVVLAGRIDEDEYRQERRSRQSQEPYTELIEFGMRDVQEAINTTLTTLKESSRKNLNQMTLGYLGDIVEEKYADIGITELQDVEDDTIQSIMNRVDESILSASSKKKLSKTLKDIKNTGVHNDHDKVVCHYFIKLLHSHNELIQKEKNIRDFISVCSKYLKNKTISYDSPTFTFSIQSNRDGQDVELYQLSSGEKQIVSLFSQIYLSNQQNYFVLIDEPELSLSVQWQRTFLEDIRNSPFCSGVVAVTHSPFIFENSLDIYAKGLSEFTKDF